jgi:fluoroacetyl-CoA thioesterase
MPNRPVPVGLKSRSHWTVTSQDTAVALRSGDLDVLATPRLLAWMERATCAVLEGELGDDETSVGTRVALEHLKASPIGAGIDVVAATAYVDGRLVRFEVVATDAADAVVGRAEITRVIVDVDRFLSRLDR